MIAWWASVYQPQWTADTLPSNAPRWARAVDAVDADLVARNPVTLIPASRQADAVPLSLLPWLADERSVDEYHSSWSEARRRAVVASAFAYHQKKGTRRALELALKPIGYGVQVVEWFEASPLRPAYTFRVRLTLPSGEPWQAEQRGTITRLANSAKNAHTKLEAIELAASGPPALIHIGIALRRHRRVNVGQVPRPTTHIQPAPVYVAALATRRYSLVIRQET